MTRSISALLMVLCFSAKSQVFNGNAGAIQNNGTETFFACPVSGLTPSTIDSVHGLEELCLSISHPKIDELYIYLISPSGRTVEISEGLSCHGQNYSNTCFNSSAAMPITSSSAPYTGTFRPIGYLGRFNDGQAGTGTWQLVVKDYMAFVNSGNLVSWSLKFGNSPCKPVILSATKLPIVIINTNSLVITTVKQVMDFAVIDNGAGQWNHPNDPRNNFNGKAAIHDRGNTTMNFEKKPYAVELRNSTNLNLKVSAPLLGMPADSDWELIAEYQDKTLMRIPMTYQLSRNMGNYAARTRNVEVMLNGEYAGVYALVEKVKCSPQRLNVRKLGPTDNSMPFISGSYLLKIDRSTSPGWSSLLPGYCSGNYHFWYQYDEPKDSVITPQQDNYIKTYMNNFETMMAGATYADPVNGYPKFVDVASCVDVFIVNEMSKNVDGYRLSSYLYKEDVSGGGKLHLGPVWDYDLAWHNCDYANTFDPTGWEYLIQDTTHPSPTWWPRFMQDSTFVTAVACRWKSLRQNVLSTSAITNYIDSMASVLSLPQQRNFRQWPILGTYIFPNPQSQANATYATEVADLKTWVNNRFSWLDGAFQNYACLAGIKENGNGGNTVSIYPNPVEHSASVKIHLLNDAITSLSVSDALGKTLVTYPDAWRPAGDSEIQFERRELPAGIYFYKLVVDGVSHTGKFMLN